MGGRRIRPARAARTSAQLRDAIDRGWTGDKLPWPDPAAAPLGTDDEAAGTPPPRVRIDRAYRAETTRFPDHAGSGPSWTLPIILVVAFVLTVGALLLLIQTA